MKKIALILGMILVLAVGWWLLSPLWTNQTVNESFPAQASDEAAVTESEDKEDDDDMEEEENLEEAQQQELPIHKLTGTFEEVDQVHTIKGQVDLYQTEEGRVIRLSEFDVTNGPDLYVYVVRTGESNENGVSLGKLKGNQGNQNYAVPDDLAIQQEDRVIIWCKAFSESFGFAELTTL